MAPAPIKSKESNTATMNLLFAMFEQHYANHPDRFPIEPCYFSDVIMFHEKFKLCIPPCQEDGHYLPSDIQSLRIKFMQEELDEYMVAIECGDMEKAFDGLIDLVYVALGTALLHKFNFAEGWKRVQAANMAKVRCERVEDSKRGSTFDVIKPVGWKPPTFADLLLTEPEVSNSADES